MTSRFSPVFAFVFKRFEHKRYFKVQRRAGQRNNRFYEQNKFRKLTREGVIFRRKNNLEN